MTGALSTERTSLPSLRLKRKTQRGSLCSCAGWDGTHGFISSLNLRPALLVTMVMAHGGIDS